MGSAYAQGLSVRIVQDDFLTREGYVLERAYPDGSADAGFGEQGRLTFTLGPDNEGPAALRLDALRRPWVAGASAGRGDRLQAVVLRFLASGAPDVSCADGGRSATAPVGRPARALDLAPLADRLNFRAACRTHNSGTLVLNHAVSTGKNRSALAAVRWMKDETVLKAGGGSQTGTLTRWGDCSQISVDPVDDCTFRSTNESIKANGSFNWNTWISPFKLPGRN